MRFEAFVDRVAKLALIDSANVLCHFRDERQMYVQLSRWHKAGKLIQLARRVYALAERYRKTEIYEPYVAATLRRPSYISLEKALEYHGLIPEAVSVYTSVTTKRPVTFETAMGVFDYRHIQVGLFWGYKSATVNHQTGFVAYPEKALLDLVYLKAVDASSDYFSELRLDSLEKFERNRLLAFAKRFRKPKILKAAECFLEYAQAQRREEKRR